MPQEVVLEETFRVPARVLYSTFLDSQLMTRVALGASAHVEPRVGGKFYLFNKSVVGELTGLEPNKEIREKWRFAEWDAYSDVVISLSEEDAETTRVTIHHTKIPLKDKYGNGDCDARVREGWKDHIFDRLVKVLGYPRVQ